MTLKKSEFYLSFLKSCDELGGSMDVVQYIDFMLVMLFVKYVSDKHASNPKAPIKVPAGCSFTDMVALKNDKEIGDKINKLLARLANANQFLRGAINLIDFNDGEKLGKGKEMVKRLTELISIFEKLDFGRNLGESDELLRQTYKHLMQYFDKQSDMRRGQFNTPTEVSRAIVQVMEDKVIELGRASSGPHCRNMTKLDQVSSFYIGWDVGGWNCDKNGKSRDAIVILDKRLQIFGKPWRGNLRNIINAATSTEAFIHALFALCGVHVDLVLKDLATQPAVPCITLAIDTPLGFSQEFVGLVAGLQCVEPIANSASNPYLFRRTERFLFEHGLAPLSAVKDMIGSQATKGMHVLSKFAPHHKSCGVWTDTRYLVAIEAYPSACKTSKTMTELRQGYPTLDHEDKTDALTCALLAYMFDQRREDTAAPNGTVPLREGWIWVPADALK